MSDTTNVTIENNTAEEVAYKLMHKIVRSSHDEAEILKTYEKCLKIVKGWEYKDLSQE